MPGRGQPVVLPQVHPEVALLLSPVGALRALERGLLAAALDLLVPPQRRLPPVPLAAVAARELRLAAVARPHDLASDHAELSHAVAFVVGFGAGFFYRVAEELSEGGVCFRSEYLLQL